MALINCPECGKENVSDSANSCPNCGYNIKEHFEKLNREIELKKAKEEREKREKEREASVDRFIDKLKTPINRFKSFTKIKKIICVLIICVLIAGIIGIVNVSSSMIRKAQIQTFQSKEAMINSVVGDYADAESVSAWAWEAMRWMTANGVIRGTGNGALSPRGHATRAQLAVMLMRFSAAAP